MSRRNSRRDREPVRIDAPIVNGRVPPHDLDAEAVVLSAILIQRDALDRVLEILKPEHFYSDANGRIYEAAMVLALAGTPIDIQTVASYLRDREKLAQVGGALYLAQLADKTPTVAHVAAHAQVVYEKWRVRHLIATCQKISAEGYGDVGVVQEFIDGAEQAVYELARTAARSEMTSIGDELRDEFKALVEATERGDTLLGYATGYRDLDERLAGLCPGDLTIIAARPGMGKTAAAHSIMLNMAAPRTARAPAPSGKGYVDVPDSAGWGCCFFGLEMPKEQTRARILCSEARTDFNRYRKRRLTPDDWRELTLGATWVSPLPLWLDHTPAMSLLELRAKVRRKQAEYDVPEAPGRPARKVGLAVVDYLTLMTPPENTNGREQEVAALSRGLKRLALELHVHVIALAQLNRECETRSTKDKRPQLSDLRESGSIEQDADNIIFLYRDDYYNPETTRTPGIAEWILGKARNGVLGTVKTKWTGKYTRFDPLAPGERDEDDA